MRDDFLVPDHAQNILHRLGELAEGDDAFVGSQPQIEGDAFGDVIGKPPARIAGLVRGAGNCRVQPITIEFKELPRIATQIWKFFLKRDHVSSC